MVEAPRESTGKDLAFELTDTANSRFYNKVLVGAIDDHPDNFDGDTSTGSAWADTVAEVNGMSPVITAVIDMLLLA